MFPRAGRFWPWFKYGRGHTCAKTNWWTDSTLGTAQGNFCTHMELNANDFNSGCVFSWVQLCDPMDCSPPGSSIHGVLQARILQWVAIPSPRGSSWHRDWTHVFCVSGIASGFFTIEPSGKKPLMVVIKSISNILFLPLLILKILPLLTVSGFGNLWSAVHVRFSFFHPANKEWVLLCSAGRWVWGGSVVNKIWCPAPLGETDLK